MAQPEAAAEVANTPVDAKAAEDSFNELAETFIGNEEEEPVDEEVTTDDEAVVEAEEDELPPIDAPVSWTAEDKEAFKALPRDIQETVQKREAERERFIQSKAQEAARARQESEQAAHQQLAQIEAQYAQQYQAIAQQFNVAEPDPALLLSDPNSYVAQMQAYKQAAAQSQQAQQQAAYYAQQAQAREAQMAQAARAQDYQIVAEHFPEYVDPTTGPKHQAELASIARELGYPNELISEARAPDILAMRKAAQWKAKADQLDKLNASKMQRVREARGKPAMVTPGVAVAQSQTRQVRADQAFSRALTAKSTAAKGEAFGEYLVNKGII